MEINCNDSERLSKYSRSAFEFSKEFSWDKTANLFEKVLNNNQNETKADMIE